MKRILSLLIAVLLLLNGFSAFGDVVFAPESEFYDQHHTECERIERDYYSNGKEGYIALYKKPNGTVTDYLRNAQKLHIFCTYKDWGMISYMNGTRQVTDKWVKMSELYLIYDDEAFLEEHQNEFYKSVLELKSADLEDKGIHIYKYPGSREHWEYTMREDELIQLTYHYKDSEDRSWGRINYHYGIRGSWICFSEPNQVIDPFGGDPNLEAFEKYSADIKLPEVEQPAEEQSAPEAPVQNDVVSTPDEGLDQPLPDVPADEAEDTDLKTPETPEIPEADIAPDNAVDDPIEIEIEQQVFAPEDPPRAPLDPLWIVAAALVAVAVIAATVLIIVCYKRKEK